MTYHVIQDNGEKYGPATIEDLRKWLTEGRIGPATVVEDENGVQKPLSELPDLSGSANRPPVENTGPADKPPVQNTAPPQASQPYSRPTANSNRTLWVVLGAVGCAAVCGISLLAAILYPVFAQARFAAKRTETMRRAKDLGKGVLMYAMDNDDLLPPVLSSAREAKPFIQRYVTNEVAYETANPDGGEFLGNAKIEGKAIDSFADPALIPLFFDSKPWPGSHNQKVVVWLDGHANFNFNFDPAADIRGPGKR